MKMVWYFDFISPFAYFQCEKLAKAKLGGDLVCKPVLFAGLLKHWEHKGPAEIPSKRRFTYRHAVWLARQQDLPFTMPPAHPFNPLGVLRLAIAAGSQFASTRAIFQQIWANGRGPDDQATLQDLTRELGVDPGMLGADNVKSGLRTNGQQALADGVFGVPTLVVGNELFWGYDATDMALAYRGDPSSFNDAEMHRAANLPIGIERKR